MLEILKLFAFLLLFLRYILWVVSSFDQKIYTPRIFLAQFAEGALVFFIFSQLFGHIGFMLFATNALLMSIGFVACLGGVLLSFFAKRELGNEWVYASVYKKQKGERLVTTGVYAVIRHPIYTGIVLSYIGTELLVGSWLWAFLLIFFIPFYFQAKKEEKFLLERFGDKYRGYMRQTKMFVPGIF